MRAESGLHLFQGFGVELEYMIVDRGTLSVRPVSDELMHAAAGEYASEIEVGELAWSNELVLHVVELKTNGPAVSLAHLPSLFGRDVARINALLEPLDACLLPTAMHPWMDPYRETHLWPHDYSAVYESYNRIFGCRGHGWANLQSNHINLSFDGDDEFGRLHAAVRLLLPIMPALAASSPIMNGKPSGYFDTRLGVYRLNQQRVPSITGRIIPEPVYTYQDYQREILEPIYREIAPLDTEDILKHEWLNSRGAIARFERSTIEIRVLDMQECPAADLAVCQAIVVTLQALVKERWNSRQEQQEWTVDDLFPILLETVKRGGDAVIENPRYSRFFGWKCSRPATAGQLWSHLVETLFSDAGQNQTAWLEPLHVILNQGCLSKRILRALGDDFSRGSLESVYRQLAECLSCGKMFEPI